jgi:hypothetical protein
VNGVQKHETRIYQAGYIPGTNRHNLKTMLRNIRPDDRLVNFQTKDIPSSNQDHQTHMIFNALLSERSKIESSMTSSLDEDTEGDFNLSDEYFLLERFHTETNRAMYQV